MLSLHDALPIYLFGKQALFAVRLIRDSSPLSQWRRARGRGGRCYWPNALELCAGCTHGGFHCTDFIEIDEMTEDRKMPQDTEIAEDLRKDGTEETAAPSEIAGTEKRQEGKECGRCCKLAGGA